MIFSSSFFLQFGWWSTLVLQIRFPCIRWHFTFPMHLNICLCTCLQIRSSHDNCYTRSTFDVAAENHPRTMPQRNQSSCLRPIIPPSPSISLKTPQSPSTPTVGHITVHDFANYMKSNYPHLVSATSLTIAFMFLINAILKFNN